MKKKPAPRSSRKEEPVAKPLTQAEEREGEAIYYTPPFDAVQARELNGYDQEEQDLITEIEKKIRKEASSGRRAVQLIHTFSSADRVGFAVESNKSEISLIKAAPRLRRVVEALAYRGFAVTVKVNESLVVKDIQSLWKELMFETHLLPTLADPPSLIIRWD